MAVADKTLWQRPFDLQVRVALYSARHFMVYDANQLRLNLAIYIFWARRTTGRLNTSITNDYLSL